MNTITLTEIKNKNSIEVLQIFKKFPYSQQWKDKKALKYAELVLWNIYRS